MLESHPRVRAYVKNHGLGFEVPYRMGAEARTYIPDFIALLDDGHGEHNPLHLIVEVKGFRGEDAKVKRETTETYWVRAVNRLGDYGRWAFVELKDVYAMRTDLEAALAEDFGRLIEPLATGGPRAAPTVQPGERQPMTTNAPSTVAADVVDCATVVGCATRGSRQ